jgi:hypothetical protein
MQRLKEENAKLALEIQILKDFNSFVKRQQILQDGFPEVPKKEDWL